MDNVNEPVPYAVEIVIEKVKGGYCIREYDHYKTEDLKIKRTGH